MKYASLLALLACASFVCAGQTQSGSSGDSKCSLTRAEAPEIRGIRLGMTPQQLMALFPEDGNQQKIGEAIRQSKRVDAYGYSRLTLQADTPNSNPRFTGVNYIAVDFLDERVTFYHVAYNGPEWKTVRQFVGKLTEAFHLPSSSWTGDDQDQQMKCDGFIINASASSGTIGSRVEVRDPSVPQVIRDRREVVKDKERQAFRP